MTPRPLSTVIIKEGEDGSTVVLRTNRGAQVRYGPFAPDGVEAAIMHLGSTLAMAGMRYQTVLRGADFGPTGMPRPARGLGRAGRLSGESGPNAKRPVVRMRGPG